MIRPHAFPALAATALLFVALAHHPYGYYTFLRWVVTLAAIMVARTAWRTAAYQWVAWPFSGIAILFNPLAPIYMARTSWRPIDIAAAFAFIASLKVEILSAHAESTAGE